MYYSKSTNGFYDEAIHGPIEIITADPAWVRPNVTVDGEHVPDADAVPDTIIIINPNCKIPPDAVEISEEDHHALLAAQSEGKIIQADADGRPVAAERAVSPVEKIKSQILALEATVTPRRLREAITGVDNGWLKNLNSQIATLRGQIQ